MRTRLYLVIEAVKEDCIEVKYKNTKEMKADEEQSLSVSG